MKRALIAIVFGLMIIGAAGYGAAYFIYTPVIENSSLQIADLEQSVSALEAEISDQETQSLSQEETIAALALDNMNLQTNLDEVATSTDTYQEQMGAQEAHYLGLQERLDMILAITVNQHYTWEYQRWRWYWDLPVPFSAYVEYIEKPRPETIYQYVDMARDPDDDYYIDEIIRQIDAGARKARLNIYQKPDFVRSFAQGLPYTADDVTMPYDEYPRYPLETLFDRGGDCEDTSILVAAILDSMGYDVALLVLENAGHMAVGVAIPGIEAPYYEFGGKQYYYLETTGEGYEIGVVPPEIADSTAYVYPV